MKNHKNGVTSVEILAVVGIIFILFAITLSTLKDTSPGYPAGTRLVRIDGCQYIESGYGMRISRTHKGNCDNPEHDSNPKLEE